MDLSWRELLRYGAEQFLLQGAWLAIQIAALAMIGGIGLGLGLALMRLSPYRRIVFRIGIHIGDVIEDNTVKSIRSKPRRGAECRERGMLKKRACCSRA
jgi:ABC-type amino acid transport system permease subunit